jgi:hypothetical protein
MLIPYMKSGHADISYEIGYCPNTADVLLKYVNIHFEDRIISSRYPGRLVYE